MAEPLKVSLTGATGSVGRQALSLARAFPERMKIVALGGWGNVAALAESALEFKPPLVGTRGEAERETLRELLRARGNYLPEIATGREGQLMVAAESGADALVSAISGAAGLAPTYAALEKGLRVALANKESLVLAGDLLLPRRASQIFPVDSEHGAIFQALGGTLDSPEPYGIILTASGGPFRGKTLPQLACVTPQEAAKHPTWAMGPKITCESALLFNKGLEVIEARHLFNVPPERIRVLVHPQSVIHSMVEKRDGSVIAQLGPSDMRLPLAYALSCPERWPLGSLETGASPLGIPAMDWSSPLTFEEPDRAVFKCLPLAEEAVRVGRSAPLVYNAAGEVGVEAFFAGRISFLAIADLVEECLNAIPLKTLNSVPEIEEENLLARAKASALLAR
ncbi:MAG: 1-deoxy-D-xylulose-5-phosphate reductoisomerase [Deltaproteobacteria bacterium]|nr:1-deoxy-D-xylulose-5-phosphate reductoisomerase [Deltaproteobacteria bacterium]